MKEDKRFLVADLFCGAGGSAVGYHRAGFVVVGVDKQPQPHYPFAFIKMDALLALDLLLGGQRIYDTQGNWWSESLFNAYHASPPCQGYIWCTRQGRENRFPLLIEPVRQRLVATGSPYVIESPARKPLHNPFWLTGRMFGLGVIRRRYFESNVSMLVPPESNQGSVADGTFITVAGHGGNSKSFKYKDWQQAIGIDWMTKEEMTEALPPAYTEYIGKYLMQTVAGKETINA